MNSSTNSSNSADSNNPNPVRKTRAELKKELKAGLKKKGGNVSVAVPVTSAANAKNEKASKTISKSIPKSASKTSLISGTKPIVKPVSKSDARAKLAKFPKELIPQILQQDKYFLIINKPAGLVVHPDGKTIEPTLCDWIVEKYPKLVGVGEPSKGPDGTLLDRPGIVHRLDRETSGVLVIAKTQEAFEFLKKSFQTRDVQKTYNTFVWGLVKEDEGTIDRPIGRSKTDFRKWSAERFARGDLRPAVTDYKVLTRKTFGEGEDAWGAEESVKLTSKESKNSKIPLNFTFIEAYPKTGRTHQIRVHFKAINHPVVGDTLYAPNHPQMLGFKRLALHSRHISFTSLNGKRVEVEAPLPEDFQKALKNFSK